MSKRKKRRPKTIIKKRAGGTAVESSARRRTLRHLRRVLAAGTAVGAASLAAYECGCNGVCDPLPPPIECQKNPTTHDFIWRFYIDADWARVGQDFVARISLTIQYFNQVHNFGFSADPQVSGGTLANVQRTAESLAFDIVPDTGAVQIDIDIPLDCEGIAEEALLRLDVSMAPAEGEPIPVTVRE